MSQKNRGEVLADWVATQNIAKFQDQLKIETDDSRHRILSVLLEEELRKLDTIP